jgi:Spy/CpxP family protein refolding chaperone
MERAILEKFLAESEAHVALGAHHVEQQRALILKLESNGCDAAEARALFQLFEELQVEHVSRRDRLRNKLGTALE